MQGRDKLADAWVMEILEPISKFLEQNDVTDILISSSENALIERAGNLNKVHNPFTSEQEVRAWAISVLKLAGSRIDIAKPLAEVSFTSQFGLVRFHAVLGGECSDFTQISIRRHLANHSSLDELEQRGFLTQIQAQGLRKMLLDKENFVIVGGTGSGKTTLLRALMNECSTERVITIEDSPELQLAGNAVPLKTRAANNEGFGEIAINQLLRASLRMRPDRLVIGEARGEELLLLLQALNTGHSGAGFTLHANSAGEAIPRMIAILASCGLSPKLATVLIEAAVHWIIAVQRSDSQRLVISIDRVAK